MFSQLIKQCIHNSPYRMNSVKINVRLLCQIPTKEQQISKQDTIIKDKNIPESRYLDYKIIYRFPFISYISLYNKMKRNMLISSSIIIPTVYALNKMNIMSDTSAAITSGIVCSSALSLYVTGALFNNQIGIIYYKDATAIKIAYVNIWGKRIDIDTTVEDIKSLGNSPPVITDKLYRTIHIASLGFPLKLIVGNSIIPDKNLLASILGDYE